MKNGALPDSQRMTSFDARAVANCIIDLAVEYDKKLTHLSLQKILYFTHGRFMIERGAPLVSGHFEAWQYGPVHPAIYSAFKGTRGKPILQRAKKLDPLTGAWTDLPVIEDKERAEEDMPSTAVS